MARTLVTLLLWLGSFSALAGECAPLIEQMENMGELKKILHCLDNKSASAAALTPKPFQHGEIKTELMVQRYLFEVEHCVRNSGNLVCTVIITNKNKTIYSPDYREFGIYVDESHLFDEFGNEYLASKGQMGQVTIEAKGPSNRNNYKDGYLEKYMSLGVPMKLVMTFPDTRNTATTVMALNIKFSFRDGKDLASEFATLEGIGIQNSGQ